MLDNGEREKRLRPYRQSDVPFVQKQSRRGQTSNLKILYEADNDLKNTYSMLAVKPDAPFVDSVTGKALPEGQVKIDTTAADVFVKWMTSEHAKALIAFYGETKYGGSLFTLMGGYLK